jgi:hypothetical protein
VIFAVGFLGVFAFFSASPGPERMPAALITVELTSLFTGKPEAILANNLQISAPNPTNAHGCFYTEMSLPMLTETYQLYEAADPVTPDNSLNCFNPDTIRADMNADIALAFLARADVATGLDRVVVIYGDGRAFIWNQPNNINE